MNLSLVVLLYLLAVMRVTRLINFDTIMDWSHEFVGRVWGPNSWQAEFLECPWCISMWVGLASAWAPMAFVPHVSVLGYVVLYLLLALSASMVTGLMAFHTSEKTGLEPDE